MKLSSTTIYLCDICGKRDTWGPPWLTRYFPLNMGGEMIFHVCSEKCDLKLLSLSKPDRKELYNGIKPKYL